jgi:hypothetical protein
MVMDDYMSQDDAVAVIFGMIDNFSPSNDTEFISREFLSIVDAACEKMSRTNKRLFLCEVMRRLMQINSGRIFATTLNRHFGGMNVRMISHYLNWCDLSREIPVEIGRMYSRLSQEQMDRVFSTVCATNNAAGARWIMERTWEHNRYTVNIVDNQITSFDVKDSGFTLTLFDQVFDSPLCRRGFKAADINTYKNKNDECAVCMDTLESTVVLNCHPSHQICEGCCDRLMGMHFKAKCPLCRGKIEPNKCTVYVM